MVGRYLNGGAVAVLLYALLFSFSCTNTSHPPADARVYVSHDQVLGYQLIRDGAPFFIKGASGSSELKRLREHGGNTVRVYEPDSLPRVLEEAHRLGLAVIADLPLPQYDSRYLGLADPLEIAEQLAYLREVVEKNRGHPALLCWMLGNEVFQMGYGRDFVRGYNELAEAVRKMDPNHPITTAAVRHQLADMNLSWRDIKVDFISLNIFGNVNSFDETRFWLSAIWRGPYLFSEWGTDGHWESERTPWQVPIEATSRKKAELLRERYTKFIAPIDDGRFLGSLAFYWGFKQEQTPTWFSLFSEQGQTSEMVFALGNLWQETDLPYPGPGIEYLLVDGKGARDQILLNPGDSVTAEATFPVGVHPTDSLRYQWRISPEDWLGASDFSDDIFALHQLVISSSLDSLVFRVPALGGPYRIYLTVSDTLGFYATANTPFFVLNPAHAK